MGMYISLMHVTFPSTIITSSSQWTAFRINDVLTVIITDSNTAIKCRPMYYIYSVGDFDV